MESLDGAIMILRVVMLIRKLKLPGFTFVTKIMYSCCGLVSTILSTMKMILDQPVREIKVVGLRGDETRGNAQQQR